MSRYLERADNLARLVTAHQNELLDATSQLQDSKNVWHPLLEVTSMGDEESTEGVVDYMVSSTKNPNSVQNCVNGARENARAIRSQISDEMWQELNSLWLDLKQIDSDSRTRNSQICEMTIRSSLQFRALEVYTLPRTDVWAFVQLGEVIERADKTSRLVDLPSFLPENEAPSAWNTMLRASSAMAAHKADFGLEVTGVSAANLLLFSTTFPRSVRYCIRQMEEVLHFLSGTPTGQYYDDAEREAGLLVAKINFSEAKDITSTKLHDFIDAIQLDLNNIGAEIGERYFQLKFSDPRIVIDRTARQRQRQMQSSQQQQQQ